MRKMNSLFLTSPNGGSFHGKNVGTFGRKQSSFCPLMHKLLPKMLTLQLKKHWSQQPAFVWPFHPPPLSGSLSLSLAKQTVFSATCSHGSNAVVAKHGRRIPYEGTLPLNIAEDEHHDSLYLTYSLCCVSRPFCAAWGEAKTMSTSKIRIGSCMWPENSQNELSTRNVCSLN